MKQTKNPTVMTNLIKCYLHKDRFDESLSDEQIKEVYALASKHDVAHLIGIVLESAHPEEREKYAPFLAEGKKALFRFAKQDLERQSIYAQFEEAKIEYIPMKGSVIRDLYHKPWHRTSCDIDILVREEKLDQAVAVLEKNLRYVVEKKSEHDVSLWTPGGVHLELHYDVHEPHVSVNELWDSAEPVRPGEMQCLLSAEMFILHHIAHMAKHFKYGGCGLRPFVDLWVIKEKMDYDRQKLAALLEEKHLKLFSDIMFELVEVWFGDAAASPVAVAAAEYILPAGAYGSMGNRVAIGQLGTNGKLGYFLARMFPAYEELQYPYPILKKHRWLLPFCHIHRWGNLIVTGKLGRISHELKINSGMDADYRNEIDALIRRLDL